MFVSKKKNHSILKLESTEPTVCIWNHFEGSLTSNDSGHGSYIPSGSGSGAVSDFHSDNGSSNNGGGLYHVACSIVHNSPSPISNDRFHPQRRHSAISHVYPGMCVLVKVMANNTQRFNSTRS